MGEQWDVITLRGLSAIGSHGVYDFERLGSQVFTADLKLFVDARVAAETDDVEHTVDYSQMAERAVEILSGPPVYLIETLASNLADMALAFPLVQKVKVTVHKPMAPIHHRFEDVSVSVTRSKTSKPVEPPATPAPHAQTNATEDVPEMERPAQLASQEIEPPAAPVARRSFPSAKVPVRQVSVPPAPAKPARKRVDVPRAAPIRSRRRPSLPISRSFTDGSPVYRIVLALGSNRGDSLRTLSECVSVLSETQGIQIDGVSPVVRTLPVLAPGAFPQKDYLNAVVLARTVLAPPVLLQTLQQVEQQFGRTRLGKWSPRTLDIDIVDIDGMELETRELTLPHPRAHQRAFVLYPWSKIDPEATLPGKGPVTQLLQDAPDSQGLLSIRERWLGERGQVLEGSEIVLNERPAKESLPLGSELPTVSVRGESLRLADVADDPIFQRVLGKELAEAKPATAIPEVSEAAPPPVISGPPAPPTSHKEALPDELPALGVPELPDWRSGARTQSPRVIEDDSYVPSTSKPITVPVKRRGRRVTMRPTPTGTIPVVARKREDVRR